MVLSCVRFQKHCFYLVFDMPRFQNCCAVARRRRFGKLYFVCPCVRASVRPSRFQNRCTIAHLPSKTNDLLRFLNLGVSKSLYCRTVAFKNIDFTYDSRHPGYKIVVLSHIWIEKQLIRLGFGMLTWQNRCTVVCLHSKTLILLSI